MPDRASGSAREVRAKTLALEAVDWKAGDGTDLPAVAAGGDFGVVYGTHGTNSPIINSEAGGAVTDIMRRTLRVPDDYAGAGNSTTSILLKLRARVDNAGMTDADIAADVRVSDKEAGLRLAPNQVQAPASIDVNSTTWVTLTFNLGNALLAGDVLDIEITGTEDDNASGGVIQIGDTFLEYDGRDN